jgi:adenylylsulfate kinase
LIEVIDYSFLKQNAITVWFTGLSGAGKSTLTEALWKKLVSLNYVSCILDGDQLRKGLNKDLGYSGEDRKENIRRIAELSKLLNSQGIICLNAFISPTNEIRDLAKSIIGIDRFFLVYVNASIDICEKRDIKGLYKKARQGGIIDFTGISAPFVSPVSPDLEIDTVNKTVDECVETLMNSVLPKIKMI